MKQKLEHLIKDESGMSVVETIIITGLLGAAAVMAWTGIRGSVKAGGDAISTKAVSAVSNAGTISGW